MAEKQSNKDRLKEITDSIEKGIQELFQSDKYRQYLRTMSRFHKYSVNNTIRNRRALLLSLRRRSPCRNRNQLAHRITVASLTLRFLSRA